MCDDTQADAAVPPLKKAKTEVVRGGFSFTFYKEHFLVTGVPAGSQVLQNSTFTKQGAPYWLSDPRFLGGGITTNTVERKAPSYESEEASASEISEDSVLQATPIMAEVVDMSEFQLSSYGMVRTYYFSQLDIEGNANFEDIHPTMLRKLSASKSPIMEALVCWPQ